MESLIDCYHLPPATIEKLAQKPVGELTPSLEVQGEITPYTALDNFDQALRHAGQLLFRTGQALALIDNDGRLITQAAPGQIAFPGDIPDGALKRSLKSASPLRRLQPVGSGLWQRAILSFTDEEQKTHCRIHFVFLTAEQGHAMAVALVQGLKGYNESFELIRAHIIEMGGLAYGGHALYGSLFPSSNAYDAKPDIPISADAEVFDTANRIVVTLLGVARANEPGIILDHDTEFLHDYRIQLRKIRSVLSLFKGVYDEPQTLCLKTEFSAIMEPTGLLRDLDVYLLEKAKYYNLLPVTLHPGLSTLYDMFVQRRTAEQARLAAHLGSKPYQERIARLTALFDQPQALNPGPTANLPVHDYACRLIWKRYRKVCRLSAQINADTPDEQVHALRIQCKKLRYLMEFFSSVFPAAQFKKLLGALKKLQNNLGLFNDYSVQQLSLGRAVQQLPRKQGTPDMEAAQSVGALIAILHHRQLNERAKIEKSIARFNGPKTREIFKQLFYQRKDRP